MAVARPASWRGELLASALPRRWAHVQGVARQAEHAASRLGCRDGVLVAAAWLHDIGYAPGVKDTGFHPLDGARYLRRRAVDEQIGAWSRTTPTRCWRRP